MLRFLALALLFLAGPALAHHAPSGWQYPFACCTPGDDCRPLADSDVTVTSKGYYIARFSAFVPFAKANSSPDGQFHACPVYSEESLRRITVNTPHEIDAMNRSGLCFWAPEGSS